MVEKSMHRVCTWTLSVPSRRNIMTPVF